MDELNSPKRYRFTETQDWFSGHIPLWRELFAQIISPAPRALEIGSWEGRSAVFTLTELCSDHGSLVCIDHFDGFRTEAGRERYAKVIHNFGLTGRPHRVLPQFSVPALMTLLQEATRESSPGFDWIYVDGSHEASDTLLDGELVWRLARKGSIIVFDDYRWERELPSSPHHPRRGIDAFMTLHAGEFEVISGTNEGEYQMILRKTVEMNIGFAFEGATSERVYAELGWGINVAMASDSEYAMPTAVAITSAIEATPGRITFYILDCGLTTTDTTRIQESMPADRPDATLVFLPLSASGLARQMGPIWAKFDLFKVLPVERALYLDADILVRKDLRPLWSTDIGSNMIAAAPDVGHPFGHPSVAKADRFPYFNAGVILIDLACTRSIIDELYQTAQAMKDSHFKDQDALNVAFRGRWYELSLKWNASGMGTYAEIPTSDRSVLRLAEMADPSIVHFTGPLHPSMDHVINPWVQPYVAKPWGYAGAPGHPHAAEWWNMLKKTAWASWKGSPEYKEMKRLQSDKARQVGLKKFEDTLLAIDNL